MATLSLSTASANMVEHSREKNNNCRECDTIITNRKLEAIQCKCCGWYFHFKCSHTTIDERNTVKESRGKLSFNQNFACQWDHKFFIKKKIKIRSAYLSKCTTNIN